MRLGIRCPICNNHTEREVCASEICLEEEYIHCECCGFDYSFAYGHYTETVGNKKFEWTYNLADCKQTQFMKKISKAEVKARKGWKKFKKRTEPRILVIKE